MGRLVINNAMTVNAPSGRRAEPDGWLVPDGVRSHS
jgi:hypothetical protein